MKRNGTARCGARAHAAHRPQAGPHNPAVLASHEEGPVSTHYVTGVGLVAIVSLGGEPFVVVCPHPARGLGLVWADNPAIGPLEVHNALKRLGRATSYELAAHLGMRQRVVGCHMRTLLREGLVTEVGTQACRRRQQSTVYAPAGGAA